MNYPSFGNKSLMGEFVETYVRIAFELAKGESSQLDFDSKLIDSVSRDCGLAKEVVLGLHHPFHWAFFLSSNGSSPLEFVQPIKLGELTHVRLKKGDYDYRDILDTSNNIIDTYGNLLIEKRKRLQF